MTAVSTPPCDIFHITEETHHPLVNGHVESRYTVETGE